MNRKKKYLVLDTETCNELSCPLVYDIGFAVCDKDGHIYEQGSYIIKEVFFGMADVMKSAYYANKISSYFVAISTGQINVCGLWDIRRIIHKVCEDWGITEIRAYNAHFDVNALNNTMRYLTKSRCRYFLPYKMPIGCIWNMACNTLYNRPTFFKFCLENNLFSNRGNLSTSAETGYRYLTQDTDFEEKHTGLEDVLIEVQIMARCYKTHKKIENAVNRLCWRIPTKAYKEYCAK